MAVRPGRFSVKILLAHANGPLTSTAGFSSSSERSRWLVAFGPEFHGDFKVWWWIVEAGMHVSERGISIPMYRLAARPPSRTFIPDAFKHAVGGFCLETDQY